MTLSVFKAFCQNLNLLRPNELIPNIHATQKHRRKTYPYLKGKERNYGYDC